MLALELVVHIGLDHSNFLETNPAPASIPTSVNQYLDFIREHSCSAGYVHSWKAVQQEADFQVLHHLLEKICNPATAALYKFTYSGLFMRTHRARMGDRMLSDFVLE